MSVVIRKSPRRCRLIGGMVACLLGTSLVGSSALGAPNPAPAASKAPPASVMGAGREIKPGIMVHQFRVQVGKRQNTVWIYLPKERPAGKLPVVLIAPAGSRLYHGGDLGDGSRPEHYPYVQAGYAVVAYSIDGNLIDNPSDEETLWAIRWFQAAEGGVTNARVALTFALQQVPGLDANQVYSAGHSSAGTLSLAVAASDPRIKGCIAYAPVCDVVAHLEPDWIREVTPLSPGFDRFVNRYSPHLNTAKLRCPVFLFLADDDSVVKGPEVVQFAKALEKTNSRLTFARVATGDHYDSMIEQGIPQALRWLSSLRAEVGASEKATPVAQAGSPK